MNMKMVPLEGGPKVHAFCCGGLFAGLKTKIKIKNRKEDEPTRT
jgi:hypothetical protein